MESNGLLSASLQQLFGAGGGWGVVCGAFPEWPLLVRNVTSDQGMDI